jgi:bifunctional ADP-heptose synthase (sugar kinase/adenylyltransferase)
VLDQFEHKHVLVVGDVSRSTALSTGTLRTFAGGAGDRDAIDVVGGPGNVARNVISLGSPPVRSWPSCERDTAQVIRKHLQDVGVPVGGLVEDGA